MKIRVDKHIYLTLLGPEHTQALYALTNQNRAFLKTWLAWLDLVETYENTQTFIDTAIHQHNHNQASSFAVVYKDNLVGIAGFNHFDHQHKWAAIGYWLSENVNGKGIMTKAVAKLIDYGFSEHNLHKIEIRCASKNLASRAIPERLGFRYEATLRDCEWLYDKFIDHAVYTILHEEYANSRYLSTDKPSTNNDLNQ